MGWIKETFVSLSKILFKQTKNLPTVASSCYVLFHCPPKHTVKKHTEAIQSSLGKEAGKVKQHLVVRSPPSNKLGIFIALKDSSHWSWWQGYLPSLRKEDHWTPALQENGTIEQVQKHCPAPPEKQAGWLAGSTSVGKASPSDKKATSKTDWSQIQVHSSLFALLKCKIQICEWISDSLWKDFSIHSSQLLNETLKGKVVQVQTPSDLSPPSRAEPCGCHPTTSCLQGCCIAGCRGAKTSHLIQHPARAWEKEGISRWSRKQFPFRSEKQQIKVHFFCYSLPSIKKNLPAIMSQSPLNNVL